MRLMPHERDFAFRLAHRVLPVKTRLKRFHIVVSDLCPLCHMVPETFEHLFSSCSKVQQALQYFRKILVPVLPIPVTWKTMAQCVYPTQFSKDATRVFQELSTLLLSAIWQHRCQVVFQQKRSDAVAIQAIFNFKAKLHIETQELCSTPEFFMQWWEPLYEHLT